MSAYLKLARSIYFYFSLDRYTYLLCNKHIGALFLNDSKFKYKLLKEINKFQLVLLKLQSKISILDIRNLTGERLTYINILRKAQL